MMALSVMAVVAQAHLRMDRDEPIALTNFNDSVFAHGHAAQMILAKTHDLHMVKHEVSGKTDLKKVGQPEKAGVGFMKAYMISPVRLYDEKRETMVALGLEPVRISPGYTSKPKAEDGCGDKKDDPNVGIFVGHKLAWKAIADGNDPAGIVLEADWTIADENVTMVAEFLKNVSNTPLDILRFGHCGWCMHAYVINAATAKKLSALDVCSVRGVLADGYVLGELCEAKKEPHLQCGIAHGKDGPGISFGWKQGYYGNGPFYQDRKKYHGVRDIKNKGGSGKKDTYKWSQGASNASQRLVEYRVASNASHAPRESPRSVEEEMNAFYPDDAA